MAKRGIYLKYKRRKVVIGFFARVFCARISALARKNLDLCSFIVYNKTL